ncbi:alpha/beta fold hydrolase [Massilia endophytica]|uniref:alpha/beta fold hydrolase n=1 Tax=Massilia endophytica TaxID=2899220 RepID=UPI001E59663B|nr:alpha/beta fold hydrolase [Massilia endophytica]UGQ48525.1 alpha/beta hydrolase [Massilia endophytica]
MKKHFLAIAAAFSLLASSALAACIDEQGFVPINGIEQWITIRGEGCENPVVLVLHGGPGNPNTPFAKTVYGPWEKRFTIVQWDQRGAGMTYGRNKPSRDDVLTVEQMRDDGIAVTQHLQKRLGKRKLILVGGSWSSVLGMHMAKARPELFAAFISTGQVVRHPESDRAFYSAMLQRARELKDTESIAKLEALGTPPWTNPRNFGIARRIMRKYEAMVTDPAPSQWWASDPFYSTPKALADYEGGEDYSYIQFVGYKGDGMLSKIDMYKLGTKFELPIFLIQGAEDLLTTPDVARRYYDAISAPQKDFVLLPRVGHDPNQAMLDAQFKLLERVRPLAD